MIGWGEEDEEEGNGSSRQRNPGTDLARTGKKYDSRLR